MTHKLVLSRICVVCDHKQPTGPKCSECGGSEFDFKHVLIELKNPYSKGFHKKSSSMQMTFFDD